MLDLNVVKQHCRIEQDVVDDDQLLGVYISAAAKYVENWTRRTLFESESSPGYLENLNPILLTDDVKAVMLLLIAHWFENREAVSTGNTTSAVPLAVESLLQPYRIYGL